MACYLRLNVTDDDGLENFTIITFGIDNTAPTTILDRPANQTNISTNTYMINASVTDSGSGVDTTRFWYRPDGSSSWISICNDSSSPYNCTWDLTGLTDGITYEVMVGANDSEGNVAANNTHYNITVDKSAPNISLNVPIDKYNSSNSWVLFNFTAIDKFDNSMNCSIYINGTFNQSNTSTQNNTPTTFNISGFSDQWYSWNITCIDYSDNVNWSNTQTFRVDTVNPNLVLDGPTNQSKVKEGNWINLTVNDSYALDTVWYSIDGATNQTSFVGTYDIDTTGWSDGSTRLQVWINDTSGRTNYSSYNFVIDGTAPSIGLYEPLQDYRTTNTWIFFNFTANDSISIPMNCTLYIVGTMNASNTSTLNNTPTTFNITDFSEAIRPWNVTCIDSVGNQQWSATRNFTIDSTKPLVNNVNPPEDSPYEVNDAVTITANVTDNVAVDTVFANVTWNVSQQTVAMTDPDSDGIYSGTFSGTTELTTYNVTIVANDTLGYVNNSAKTNFTVIVALTNLGTPNMANLTDGPSILTFGFGGDNNKNVTSQLANEDGSCTNSTCADMDERANYQGAYLDSNWINSIDAGSTITDARVRLKWDYDSAKGVPNPEAYFYYKNASGWVAVSGCQDLSVPLSASSYICNLGSYIDTVAEANNATIRILTNDSWAGAAGDEPEARIWVNVINLSVGYYDSQKPAVRDVNATPSPANISDTINITANITDNTAVNRSQANISYPNGTSTLYNMSANGDIWYYEFSNTIVVGTYNVTFVAYDEQNNLNNSESTNFTINDVVAPNVTINLPVDTHNTTNTSMRFNWTPTDDTDSSLNCNLTIDGGINVSGLTATSGSWSNITVDNITSGTHSWNVSCWDGYDNKNTSLTRNFTIVAAPSNLNTTISNNGSNLTISWPDLGYADSYNIYITEDYGAGFGNAPNVTGVSTNQWTDGNADSATARFYKIETVKGGVNETSTEIMGKYSYTLTYNGNVTDWNLISAPFIQSTWDLDNGTNNGFDPFVTSSGCIQTLWRYRNTSGWQETDHDGSTWSTGVGSENFTSLQAGAGYWAEINKSCTLIFSGRVPTTEINVTLYKGWNLISWYSPVAVTLPTNTGVTYPIDVNPADSVDHIDRYITVDDSFEVTNYFEGWGWWPSWNNQAFTTLEPMKAYYFDVNQNCTWDYDPNT